MRSWLTLLALGYCYVSASADDVTVGDFEKPTYGEWISEGEAFGSRPSAGRLPDQQQVSGYRGNGLVNSYHGGDDSTGELRSPHFRIERKHLCFLVGGGRLPGEVGLELLVDGEVVRTATGPESETLIWHTWNVGRWLGKSGRLRIFDRASGGWGHILVDQVVQTDAPRSGTGTWRLDEYRRSPDYYQERLRPRFHFSPELNWMNDPNGLVFHDGEYHLFYQHNPLGNSWGHMSWGHAVSSDLLHWKHLPIALREEYGVMIFSGCCVIDHENTSGFGNGDGPPIVAIYTGHGHGRQTQDLAYSTDRGRTWTKYEGNPVIDVGESNFRDPKVFWHEPTSRWIMVVSLATEKILVFYSSADLKQWTELSRFGPAGEHDKPNWECPDLFELAVEGNKGETMWILEADMGRGSIAGGSGGEYFVGKFDGETFSPIQESRWVDYGRDFYAPVSWANIPEKDGRRIWIGWLNNWETNLLPTSPWRSCQSIPRKLALRQVPAAGDEQESEYTLVQRPIEELWRLAGDEVTVDTGDVGWPPQAVTKPGELPHLSFALRTRFAPGTSRSCGLRVRTGEEEFTEVGYDRQHGSIYVDRRNSGIVNFHPAFPGRHDAPARLIDGEVKLLMVVDRSTIEVFINDGEAVISDRIFPRGQTPVIEAFAGDGSARIGDTTVQNLRSVWNTLGDEGNTVAVEENSVYIRRIDVAVADAHGLAVPVDLFIPRRQRNGRAIIDVASGAWYSDRGKIRDHREARMYDILCQRGYLVCAVRPGSISRFTADDMTRNIQAAVRWMQKRADEFKIDPSRVGITGASAGGHLASLVALRSSGTGGAIDPPIAAAAVFFPPSDFTDYGGRSIDPRDGSRYGQIVRKLAFPDGVSGLDESQIAERIARISPVKQVHTKAPPFLLIHGDADPVVPLQQSRKLFEALQAHRVPTEFIVKPGGAHPWPTIHEEVASLADWFDRRLEVEAPASGVMPGR